MSHETEGETRRCGSCGQDRDAWDRLLAERDGLLATESAKVKALRVELAHTVGLAYYNQLKSQADALAARVAAVERAHALNDQQIRHDGWTKEGDRRPGLTLEAAHRRIGAALAAAAPQEPTDEKPQP